MHRFKATCCCYFYQAIAPNVFIFQMINFMLHKRCMNIEHILHCHIFFVICVIIITHRCSNGKILHKLIIPMQRNIDRTKTGSITFTTQFYFNILTPLKPKSRTLLVKKSCHKRINSIFIHRFLPNIRTNRHNKSIKICIGILLLERSRKPCTKIRPGTYSLTRV